MKYLICISLLLTGCAGVTPEESRQQAQAKQAVAQAEQNIEDAKALYQQSPTDLNLEALKAARDQYVSALEQQVETEAGIIAARTERTGMNLASVIAKIGGGLAVILGIGGGALKGGLT